MSIVFPVEINADCQDSTPNGSFTKQEIEYVDTEKNLNLACQTGNLELFARLFKSNTELKSSELSEALYIAIDHHQLDIVKFLLNNGVNPNVKMLDKFIGNKPDSNKDICGSALHIACHKENYEIIKALLSHGADVNSMNDHEDTPLFVAIIKKNLQIVELLLKNGVDVNIQNSDGITALYVAVTMKKLNTNIPKKIRKITFCENMNEKLEIVRILCKYCADVNIPNRNGSTVMHLASAHKGKNVDILLTLLDHGGNANIQDNKGNTPLHEACKVSSKSNVRAILKYGVNPNIKNKQGKTPLHVAASSVNSKKIIVEILNQGGRLNIIDKSGDYPLHIACREGLRNNAEALLNFGANTNVKNKKGQTPLHIIAASGRREKILTAVLDKGTETNIGDKMGNTALHKACEVRQINYVKAILNHGGNPNVKNKDGKTSLHVAACTVAGEEIVKSLIEKGADPNIQDIRGYTPLHESCVYYRKCNFKTILENGAHPNIQNKEGKTPLHLVSARLGCEEFLTALLARGAYLNVQDHYGNTPIFYAENPEKTIIILKYGGNPNIKNNLGETAVYSAARKSSDIDKLSTLLDNGGDPNISNNEGKTAIHIAIELVNMNTVKVLLNYGCDINVIYRNKTLLEFAINCNNQDVISTIGYHIVKRNSANFYVNNESLKCLGHYKNKFESFQLECHEELKRMKCETIGNSKATFYNVLKGTLSSVASYAKNEDIVRVMSSDYVHNYPIYETMMTMNFKNGMERKKLQETAFEKCKFIFNSFLNLPDVCIHKIMNFLTNADMKLLSNL